MAEQLSNKLVGSRITDAKGKVNAAISVLEGNAPVRRPLTDIFPLIDTITLPTRPYSVRCGGSAVDHPISRNEARRLAISYLTTQRADLEMKEHTLSLPPSQISLDVKDPRICNRDPNAAMLVTIDRDVTALLGSTSHRLAMLLRDIEPTLYSRVVDILHSVPRELVTILRKCRTILFSRGDNCSEELIL
jgi:hypothetical protein